MSNRMKIKARAPRLTKQEEAEVFDLLCSQVFFYFITSLDGLERSIREMLTIAREEELLHIRQVSEGLDDMNHILRSMKETIVIKSGKFQVETSPLITYGDSKYARESRVIDNLLGLARKRLSFVVADCEQKAKTVSLNQPEYRSKAMFAQLLMCDSWCTVADFLITSNVKRWEQVRKNSRHFAEQRFDVAERLLYQMSVIAKKTDVVMDAIGKASYDESHPMWLQLANAVVAVRCTLMGLATDSSFNRNVSEYSTHDWMDYYIANAVIETQKTGAIPEQVIEELSLLGEATNTEILLPARRMLTQVAQKAGATEDHYDIVDYLEEHPWKVVATIHDKAWQLVEQMQKAKSA